jgi:hypothetical protein
MYDKGKFCLLLWYDGPANLMSDIVKRCMCGPVLLLHLARPGRAVTQKGMS